MKFKDPAFREEREWRFVITNPSPGEMSFRAGHSDIKPYIEINPIAKDGSGRLPLRKIIFGPTLRNDESMADSLKMMLKRYRYENVQVQSCGIPYRL